MDFMATFLEHVKGEWAGQLFTLQDWQTEIVRAAFGWKRPDGTRKYRIVFLEVPRKNGKSTLAAGIALVLLFADSEPGAEVYSAAGDRGQASIVFDVANSMVQNSSDLTNLSQSYRRSISVPKTASSYKVLSADAFTKHGLNAHGVIFDELHTQPSRDLRDVLTTSTGARRQPMTFAITTAGYDRHSICYEIHDYAEKVRDGMIEDDSMLPVIYASETEDSYLSPKVWKKANPGLGVSVKTEYIEQEAKRASEVPAFGI